MKTTNKNIKETKEVKSNNGLIALYSLNSLVAEAQREALALTV